MCEVAHYHFKEVTVMENIGWGTIPLVLGLIVVAVIVGAYLLGKRKR